MLLSRGQKASTPERASPSLQARSLTCFLKTLVIHIVYLLHASYSLLHPTHTYSICFFI
ncbi:hypothetical protein HanIR_Chr14g0673621 [Helianthus annuus]|nr:hypothetical protein HanIR_Chr14g0673621 [Helianthus annuus]